MPQVEYCYKMVDSEIKELKDMIINFNNEFDPDDAAKYGNDDPGAARLNKISDWVNELVQEAFETGRKEGLKVIPTLVEFKK